jgi:hypothetical protein
MKTELNKIISNILLLILLGILIFITFSLRDISKNGRFQKDGGTILDTRTGQTYEIQFKNIQLDSSDWELIPNTKPIIKE